MNHKDPTAWLPVARAIKWFACLNGEGEVTCRHRSARAFLRCRKGKRMGAFLKNGALIRLTLRYSGASNGENAYLPYASTPEDYEQALNCK